MSEGMHEPGRNGTASVRVEDRVARPALTPVGREIHASVTEVVQAPCESPSLLPHSADDPAYEMKFLLGPDDAHCVEAWAARHLPLDAHADPALGNAYRTVSLYLDTPALDVFHRVKPFRRRKFRVRRYGGTAAVFLERKARKGDQVRKRRCVVPEGDLALLDGPGGETAWPGWWFKEEVLASGLRPVCLVGYERLAHAGLSAEGPVRLTIDRNVRCLPAAGWQVGEVAAGLLLLEGQAILELKFRGALPSLFKLLIEELRLTPAAASKYRLGVRAWGLDCRRVADV
jgi:hypothetical protein